MNRNPWLIRDVLMLLAMLFMAQVFILMAKNLQEQQKSGAIDSPGQLAATITWPEGNQDVDLWVTGPGEPHPVGYSSANGLLWNLLRDDLGTQADLMPINLENAYTRGVPDGLYAVNVHCFRCNEFPIPVSAELREKDEATGKTSVAANNTVELTHDKQEATVFQFLVKDGKVDRSSVTEAFKSMLGGNGK